MPKAYVERLEAQVETLRERISRRRDEQEALHDKETDNTAPARQPILTTRFVGEEHAMGFIRLILETIRSQAKESLYVLTDDQIRQNQPEYPYRANEGEDLIFPLGREIGLCLMQTYLRRGHPRHPFLPRNAVVAVCEKVLHDGASQVHVSDEECFRAYAIFAIGAAYRKQELSLHPSESAASFPDPTMLFSIAMRRRSNLNLLSGLDGIQNLLLVARFGFFYLTGASLWEISSLCMHVCIDVGLHQPPRLPLSAFGEQMRRRVFWQCYNMNRHCATTLGLPFGIADSHISVMPIADIEDEVLLNTVQPLDAIELSPPGVSTDLSLMIWQVQLRQICSKMREDFKNLKRLSQSDSGEFKECEDAAALWDVHVKHASHLSRWRSEFPLSFVGNSPLNDYLSTTWRDLHYFQEKLFLVRCSIDHSSSQSAAKDDPLDLVEELYNSASNVVKLYSQILGVAGIELTVGRLYRVLTAGLSALFTVVIEVQNAKRDSGKPLLGTWLEARLGVLKLCRDTLESMSTQFMAKPAAGRYVGYFELLCREVLKNFVEPYFRQRRNLDPGTTTAHEELPQDTESRSYLPSMAQPAQVESNFDGVPPSTTSPEIPLSAHEFNDSLWQEPIDVQSLGSPFAWLNNPYAVSDFTELTCLSTQDHIQPCHCGLMSAMPMLQVPDLASYSNQEFSTFSIQSLDWPSGTSDGFPMTDWGDILEGFTGF
jgi:hypothetical protein